MPEPMTDQQLAEIERDLRSHEFDCASLWGSRFDDCDCNGSERFQQVVAEVRRLRAERDAVLALHVRYDGSDVEPNDDPPICDHCSNDDNGGEEWPCPTLRALGVTEAGESQ